MDAAEKDLFDEELVFKKILGLNANSPYNVGEKAAYLADYKEISETLGPFLQFKITNHYLKGDSDTA